MKFWASGDDDDSSSYSEDKDDSSLTLTKEALDAGFTIEQIKQAEEELSSPRLENPKVCSKLKERSISKKLLDLWISNHHGRDPCLLHDNHHCAH
jgi:DNA-binding transcriptional MerR regulator